MLPPPPVFLSIGIFKFFAQRRIFVLLAVMFPLFWGEANVCALGASVPFPEHCEAAVALRMPQSGRPQALLALFPGCNEDAVAAYLGNNSAWLEFAQRSHVALMAVTLRSASSPRLPGQSYYYPELGSGEAFLHLLDDGERSYSRLRELPLYLFGFSGGAHFVHRFAQWRPERVAGFCAYSAGWWTEPTGGVLHLPAFMLCGYQDERFPPTLTYFQQGRARGAPWTFARVRHTGHELPARAVTLAQGWLEAMFQRDPKDCSQVWRGHLYREEIAEGRNLVGDRNWLPTSTVWLPDTSFACQWKTFLQGQQNSSHPP